MRVGNYMVTGQRRLGAHRRSRTLFYIVDGVHVSVPAVSHYKPGTPMKTARFLLACVAASLLAACSADSITAPATPARPSFDESVGPGDGGEGIDGTGGGPGSCIPVVVVNP